MKPNKRRKLSGPKSGKELVFESPVGSGFLPYLGATATATGCQIRKFVTTATATACNRFFAVALKLRPVATGCNRLLSHHVIREIFSSK
jgi:hypothetical protein